MGGEVQGDQRCKRSRDEERATRNHNLSAMALLALKVVAPLHSLSTPLFSRTARWSCPLDIESISWSEMSLEKLSPIWLESLCWRPGRWVTPLRRVLRPFTCGGVNQSCLLKSDVFGFSTVTTCHKLLQLVTTCEKNTVF